MNPKYCCLALVAAALGIAGAVAWRASPPDDAAPATSAVTPDRPSSRPVENAIAAVGPAPVAEESARHDHALIAYTEGKYRFLFAGMLQRNAANETLQKALLEREHLAVALNTARQGLDVAAREEIPRIETALTNTDFRIRALLHPTDYAAYEALKNSDVEQFQLDDYAAGISHIAPLSDADRRAILLTKLNYKRSFRQILLDSGLLRSDLTSTQREQLYAGVSRALEEYRNSYLEEVRQYLLDDEQYALLRNYESSEFSAELAKLQSIASGG
jgi:hypothetical protein